MSEVYLILAYTLSYLGLVATSFYFVNLFLYYRKNNEVEPLTNKKVSILIPAYNEEEGIEKTLNSVLEMDYPKENLEIIVIDDGSTDRTYELAKKFESKSHPKISVFRKENGGKGSALNYALEKAKGEIVISMDADTFVKPDALKIMMGHFRNKRVMAVAPSMGVHKPKGLWGRIIQIEYYMGVFLRKSFATMNAIHITPGAFSAYRKKFFDKYGGYDVGNLTEDLEIALRIQSKHYIIENSSNAVAYTSSPLTFKSLLFQRRRWYVGLVKNLKNYRHLFSPKYGALGTIVLPIAAITVIFSTFLTIYMLYLISSELVKELIFLKSINFQFNGFFEVNSYLVETFLLKLFSRPLFLLTILFISLIWFYVKYSRHKMNYKEKTWVNFILFTIFYAFLFTFWWAISFIYILFNRDVKWREEIKNEEK